MCLAPPIGSNQLIKTFTLVLLILGYVGCGHTAPDDADGFDVSEEARSLWEEAFSDEDAEASLRRFVTLATDYADDSLGARARFEWLRGLYSLGRAEEALEDWKNWAQDDSSVLRQDEFLYWFALTLLDAGEIGEAARLLEEAQSSGFLGVSNSYLDGMTQELLVSCYLELGEAENAVVLGLDMVRHTRSEDLLPVLLHDLARAYEEVGEFSKAAQTWRHLLESYPSTPEAAYAAEKVGAPSKESSPRSKEKPAFEADQTTITIFTLYLASFPDSDRATLLAAKAGKLGMTARVEELEAPSGPLFSVVAGPFFTRSDAERAKSGLASRLDVRGIVIGEQAIGE